MKSELIRHMLDDIDNSELEQVVPLRHSSCTLHIVKAIMNYLIEAEKGEVNMAAFIFSLDLMAFIIALNFLEINELLRIAARTRGTLHAACVNSNLDIVKVLIEANADLESVDSDGRSPLDVVKDADCRKEIELAIILSEGWTHLMIHARRGETGKIKALIDSDGGKLVNERNGNGTGRVALHYAAERGHTDAARALIEGRADIDVKDKVTRCRFSLADSNTAAAVEPDAPLRCGFFGACRVPSTARGALRRRRRRCAGSTFAALPVAHDTAAGPSAGRAWRGGCVSAPSLTLMRAHAFVAVISCARAHSFVRCFVCIRMCMHPRACARAGARANSRAARARVCQVWAATATAAIGAGTAGRTAAAAAAAAADGRGIMAGAGAARAASARARTSPQPVATLPPRSAHHRSATPHRRRGSST